MNVVLKANEAKRNRAIKRNRSQEKKKSNGRLSNET